MANKALGRDLGDLLSRARPARMVAHVGSRPATPEPGTGTGPGPGTASTAPDSVAPPIPQDLPLDPPAAATAVVLIETPVVAPALAPAPAVAMAPPVPRATPVGRRPFAPPGASGYSASGPAPRANPPPPAGSMAAFLVLLGIDSILLITGAALAFTDWVPAPLSSYLALVAVLAGAACSALAYLLRPAPAPKSEPSKVRVQLRRI